MLRHGARLPGLEGVLEFRPGFVESDVTHYDDGGVIRVEIRLIVTDEIVALDRFDRGFRSGAGVRLAIRVVRPEESAQIHLECRGERLFRFLLDAPEINLTLPVELVGWGCRVGR